MGDITNDTDADGAAGLDHDHRSQGLDHDDLVAGLDHEHGAADDHHRRTGHDHHDQGRRRPTLIRGGRIMRP